MIIPLNLGEQSYDIVLERGALNKASEYLNLNRKCLIVTDDGVPSKYAQSVKNQAKEGYICVIPQGEKSKSFDNYKMLLEKMGISTKSLYACIRIPIEGSDEEMHSKKTEASVSILTHIIEQQ